MIEFDDTIADMIVNKRPHPAVIELFIRHRKENISRVFVSQSYFAVPKDARLNTTHFIMEISSRQDFPQIVINH